MYMDKLVRLTLVRKSRATAKHPANRDGVIEVIKAAELDPVEYDWYEAFNDFVEDWDGEPPEDWCAAFDESFKEAAKKKGKNYPDGSGPFAGPHNSFPIASQRHVYAAARLLGHADNPAQVKANIIRIAHEKGYSLPKSWVKKQKVTKSMQVSPEKAAALVQAMMQMLNDDPTPTPEESEAPVVPAVEEPKTAAEAEPEVETPAAEEEDPESPESKEAARPAKGHSHSHAHLSAYGYSYSHTHQHGDADHASMPADEHDQSEIAHAHEHVEKADSFGEDDIPMLVADRAGLKSDLDTARESLRVLEEKVASLEAERAQAVEKAQVAEVKAQDAYKNLLRRPMTLPPTQSVEKAKREITPDMSWDEAFKTAMGRD